MHHALSRIRETRIVLRIFILMLLSAGVGVASYFGASSLDLQSRLPRLSPAKAVAPSRMANAPVRVSVAPALVEDVAIYLTGIGTVQAYNTVSVRTRVDGEITEIRFVEGQDVNAGDPLAIIDPRPYQAQLRQQIATKLKDQALLDTAILDLKRYETLVKTRAVSEQQFDTQRYLVEQYKAQVETDQAQIDYAKVQLEYTTIRAPVSGRTGIRQVDQGNIVHAADNTTIVVLTQLRPISVIFTLPANAVADARLVLGKTKIPAISYSADGKRQLDRGSVDLIDNQIDQTTGTIKLKASFPNLDLRLWPGDFVNGRFVVDSRPRATRVPSVAVRHGPRGDFVWVVRSDNTAEYRSIVVGQSSDGRTLIERGLQRGEQVATDGYFRLENGTRVEIVGNERAPGFSVQAAPLTE
jgi:membrane fusion protein, multidrug efflux system